MQLKNFTRADKTANLPSCPSSNSIGRLLVLDDNSDICRLNAEALKGSGYQVDTVGNGAEAWEALQLKSYYLFITDNQMPKVSGIELVKLLQTENMPVPVTMVTGTMPEDVRKKERQQLETVVVKPYALEELVGMVRNILQVNPSGHAQNRSSNASLTA